MTNTKKKTKNINLKNTKKKNKNINNQIDKKKESIKILNNDLELPNDPIIFIVGYAGAGKSYLSKKFINKKYYVISCDEIIKKHLMQYGYAFGIYAQNIDKNLESAKNKFIQIIKQIIKKHKKVIIEGQIENIEMIHNIVGKSEFRIIFVKPKNIKSYTNNLINRFVDDPANYGRIGRLGNADSDGKGLNDYIKNGINGYHIKKLIKNVAKSIFFKHQEKFEYYNKNFNNVLVYLT
jgi:guanylate kinase